MDGKTKSRIDELAKMITDDLKLTDPDPYYIESLAERIVELTTLVINRRQGKNV